jgi:predicted phage terminase large subunit-like protein
VKEAWLQTYEQVPANFELVVQSWDTANKDTELSDYSVCTTWGLLKGHMYLLHVLRQRLTFPDLKRAVQEQARLHKATAILIEDRASGTQLIQELRRNGLNTIHARNPEGDKAMRLHVRTPWFEAGKVMLPKEAPWLVDYRKELLAFPKTKHDDQVDATTQALAWADEPRSQMAFHFAVCPRKEAFHREMDSFMGSMGRPHFPGGLGW